MTRTPLLVRIKRKREDDTPEDGFLLNDTYFVRQRTVRSTVSASVCHSNCEGASRTTAECASALHLSGKKEIAAHTNVEEERFVRRRSRLCVESIHQGVLTGILIPVPSRATENRCNQDDSHSLPPPSRVADAQESNMQRLRRKRLRSVLCEEYVPFRVLGNNVSEATVPTSPLERVENRQDDKLPVMSTSIKHTMIMNKQWIDPNNQEDMNEVVEVFLDLDKQKECDVSSSGDVFLLANTTGNSSVSCYSSTFADDEYELHEDYATNTHLYHDDWFDTEQPVTLDETDDSNDNEGYDYPDGDGCEIRTRKCTNMRDTIYDYSSTRRWRWASQKTDSDDYDVY